MSRKLYARQRGPPPGGQPGSPLGRDRATRAPVAAMTAAEVSSVTEIPLAWARAASAKPPMISPVDSAWDRNECRVVRTSLVVRRFTQITLTAWVTLNEGAVDAAGLAEFIGQPRD